MGIKRKVEIIYKNSEGLVESRTEYLNISPYFERAGLETEADLISIATAVFILEQYNIYNVEKVNISLSPHSKINYKELKKVIQKLILFLIDLDVEVDFIIENYLRKKDLLYEEKSTYDYIVPFSGGMDSFAGVLISKDRFDSVAAVTAGHKNQGAIQSLVHEFYEKILSKHRIPWRHVSVEQHPLEITQTRGFLYMALAGLFTHFFGAKQIIITECGLTMHQPKFTNADIITKTTDPYLMKLTKKLLNIYNINIKFILPFSDLTKAEIASITPEKEYIKETNSCLNTMWAKRKDFTHCGVCYGCVLRKISNIVAGVKDANYASFILIDEPGHPYLAREGHKVSKDSYDNLVHMTNFAYNLLADKSKLLFYTRKRIKRYKKEDLFHRFALDLFSAIYLLKRGKVNSFLENIYKEAIYSKLITEDDLKKRIKDVRSKKYKPNFNLVI